MPEWSPTVRIRRIVTERAEGRCEYCLCPSAYVPDPLVVEHIVPRSRGGSHSLSNLALSCHGGNSYKYTSTEATDPVSGERAQLYDPRRHSWREHFAWSEDTTRILGLTPIGRATIAKLDLNRPSVVNLRALLHAVGKHPPPQTLDGVP